MVSLAKRATQTVGMAAVAVVRQLVSSASVSVPLAALGPDSGGTKDGAPPRQKQYYPQSRSEHLIALGRMVLAASFLLAAYLDPCDPIEYARLSCRILTGYLTYSLVIGIACWRKPFTHRHLQIFTHCVDLSVFALLMFITYGPTSPFFVSFIFLLVCATFRWQWPGMLLTAGVAMAVVVAVVWYPPNLPHNPDFELNRLILRIIYLAVVAALLGYLGAHEQSMRNVLMMLGQWPAALPETVQATVRGILKHAAAILDSPRILLAWEEEEEPWLHLAYWSASGFECTREPPAAFGAVVAENFPGSSFFCRDVGDPGAAVIYHTSTGFEKWPAAPLHLRLQERYSIRAVVVSKLQGEKVSGYLLALDKPSMTADDLVLGGIVSHEVAARLDHFLLVKQLQSSAAAEERVRLARDLHDGLLQSLTAAALQLETAERLLETAPQTARQRLQETQQLLAAERRDLREQINDLRPFIASPLAEEFQLKTRLLHLSERITSQSHLAVSIKTFPEEPAVPRALAKEVYFLVHEALTNAVRHAGASALRAELFFNEDVLHIVVVDDGKGFAFRGRYKDEALAKLKTGPVTLRERVAALNGTLCIDSDETGARVEMSLPLSQYGG